MECLMFETHGKIGKDFYNEILFSSLPRRTKIMLVSVCSLLIVLGIVFIFLLNSLYLGLFYIIFALLFFIFRIIPIMKI